jgi:hypothetical protein
MKHGCFTTFQSPIDSAANGLNVMNRNQSVERRNGLLARLWHQYFRMGVVLYSSITSKRARFEEERIAVSSKKCTVSQKNQNDGKIA